MSFSRFIRERQFIANVSPRTLEWYQCAFKWLPTETPTQSDLTDTVIRMREKGLKPTGVNSLCRVLNAYCHWLHAGGDVKCSGACKHPKVPRLAEEQRIMPTFTEPQIKALVRWKPTCETQRRLHLLVLFMLDTGCRISEATALRVSDIDSDNLLVTLTGKGRKQRRVPISVELRRAIYRHMTAADLQPDDLLFDMERNNARRAVKRLCKQLGFAAPERTLHSFRHTFAANYLRRGGGTFHLQKALGHTTLEMTRRYSNLNVADLSAVHQRVSLLK
jgi:integrase/recombinase XerD